MGTLTAAIDYLDPRLDALPDPDECSWDEWGEALDILADDMEEHGWAVRSGPTAGVEDVRAWEVSRLGIAAADESLADAARDWCASAASRLALCAAVNGVDVPRRPRALGLVGGA